MDIQSTYLDMSSGMEMPPSAGAPGQSLQLVESLAGGDSTNSKEW